MSEWWRVLFFVSGLGVFSWLHYCRAGRRLDAWARDHHVRIVRRQWRILLRGPHGLSGRYEVFRIVAADGQGGERVGWVRLGGFFLGLRSDESKVLWEWEKKEGA